LGAKGVKGEKYLKLDVLEVSLFVWVRWLSLLVALLDDASDAAINERLDCLAILGSIVGLGVV
jgi:hypothetical protein